MHKHLETNSSDIVTLAHKHLDALFTEAKQQGLCFECTWSVVLRDAITNTILLNRMQTTPMALTTMMLQMAEESLTAIATGNYEITNYAKDQMN